MSNDKEPIYMVQCQLSVNEKYMLHAFQQPYNQTGYHSTCQKMTVNKCSLITHHSIYFSLLGNNQVQPQ